MRVDCEDGAAHGPPQAIRNRRDTDEAGGEQRNPGSEANLTGRPSNPKSNKKGAPMTRTLLLALSLLVSVAWVQAQAQYPQTGSSQTGATASGQTTVEGCLQHSEVFFMMIHNPRRSNLFPYTTLFRGRPGG